MENFPGARDVGSVLYEQIRVQAALALQAFAIIGVDVTGDRGGDHHGRGCEFRADAGEDRCVLFGGPGVAVHLRDVAVTEEYPTPGGPLVVFLYTSDLPWL